MGAANAGSSFGKTCFRKPFINGRPQREPTYLVRALRLTVNEGPSSFLRTRSRFASSIKPSDRSNRSGVPGASQRQPRPFPTTACSGLLS